MYALGERSNALTVSSPRPVLAPVIKTIGLEDIFVSSTRLVLDWIA